MIESESQPKIQEGNRLNITDNIVRNIKEYLIKELAPHTLILFGSSVKGYFREDSDIDIAFISAKQITCYDLYLLAQALAIEVGREVDLINFSQASTVFKAQILGLGQVIYSNNPEKLAECQIWTLKEYALLNEERAEILRNISVRGSVYGG